ncbi:prolyl 4-hydroxylase subunit alpha-2-like [Drosophila ficusphila]|uniref:prolyl 4-hydroxylase subunit alpha-2-like n=1 Tax=Drosophila ficusphila TaxID=30025 RepID=UPI0007E67AEC|nr:prolyl 4-hydroxylase subunit alpha-2-like [Drosophila ficusphila]
MFCKWIKMSGCFLILLLLPFLVKGKNEDHKSHALSVASMAPLLELEAKLIDSLEAYANRLEEKLQVSRSHIPVIRAENEKARLDAIYYLSIPLNGFSLLRRLHQDWPKWRTFMKQSVGTVEKRNFDGWKKDLPKAEDLSDACAGIVRIQKIYDLKVEDIVRGELDGRQYNSTMSTADIFAVGRYLAEGNSSMEAVQWLQEVHHRIQKELPSAPVHLAIEEVKVLKLLAETYVKNKHYSKALPLVEQGLMLRAQSSDLLRLFQKIKDLIETQSKPSLKTNNKKLNSSLAEAHRQSCRGLLRGTTRLHCSYNFSTTHFLRLAPLKVEQIGWDPYVVLYHNVLSPLESAQLIELAALDLRTSGVLRSTGVSANRARSVKARWVMKELNELTRRITRRVGDMTGLDLRDSEKFQIINYGIGGHYTTHKDYFNASTDLSEKLGDRVATVLFYLTDVEQGGATVFPKSGYTIYPRAGTALFWYNLHRDGNGDISTMHAACPVIVGSKWVMTEWIRERSQIFRRPCLKN